MIAAADPRVLCAIGHTRNANGTLAIAGVGVDELAKAYGTPLVVFDASTFEGTLERFHRAAEPHGISIAYAAKALLFVALVRRIARHAWLKLDVCSSGEIATAERGGLAASRMYLHGCGKSEAELDAAIEGRVAFIVVDGIDELACACWRAHVDAALTIGLRFNTGIEIHTHDFVRTGGENTKFGIAPGDLERALDVLDAHPNVALGALHAHMGSQIFDEAPYAANLDVLAELAARAHARGRTIPSLLLGGGFGVDEDVAADRDVRYRGDARRTWRSGCGETASRAGIPVPRLGIEPGRSLVANAGDDALPRRCDQGLRHPPLRRHRRQHRRQPPAGDLRSLPPTIGCELTSAGAATTGDDRGPFVRKRRDARRRPTR